MAHTNLLLEIYHGFKINSAHIISHYEIQHGIWTIIAAPNNGLYTIHCTLKVEFTLLRAPKTMWHILYILFNATSKSICKALAMNSWSKWPPWLIMQQQVAHRTITCWHNVIAKIISVGRWWMVWTVHNQIWHVCVFLFLFFFCYKNWITMMGPRSKGLQG